MILLYFSYLFYSKRSLELKRALKSKRSSIP